MEFVKEQIGKNTISNHLIFFDGEIEPYTLASYVLLKSYYRSLDREYDWRYYWIARKHFLRTHKRHGKWTCHYCGKDIFLMDGEDANGKQQLRKCATIDHKIPMSEFEGDRTDEKNWLISCYDCNVDKKSQPYKPFYQSMQRVRIQNKINKILKFLKIY
jgi:5-methylcytosine-specific restriction endonuclease McrA